MATGSPPPTRSPMIDDGKKCTTVWARYFQDLLNDIGSAGADHASTHISGGADEIDGDRLDIDWNPPNYTPSTSPSQASSVDHLTAHLKGIDTALSGKSSTSHASDHITNGSDEIDGDKVDIDWNPPNYTPSTSPAEADNGDNLTAHLKGIDTALTGKASTSHAGNHITGASDEIDGDKLDIDWDPPNYTPSTSPAEASSVDNLTAHLKGIDTALTGKASTTHAMYHMQGGSDEFDGDKLDIDWNPSNYTPSTSPAEASTLDNLTAHLKGIDTALGTTNGFVDRGDPANYDWAVGDFTTDWTWNDLDCSGIVPAGTAAIVFAISLVDGATNSVFQMRCNGNGNDTAANTVRTQVVNLPIDAVFTVPCDANRKVEYRGSNLAFTSINVVILGWFV